MGPVVFGRVALDVRARRGGGDNAAGAAHGYTGRIRPIRRSHPADSPAARDAEIIWKRAGNPDVRHPVDVVRTIDGDTFEARVHLWPGLDLNTRVRLRGIDAPELKAACPQELQMAEAASDALRGLLGEGEVTIFHIGPDKYRAGSLPTLRPGGPRMYRQHCSPPVMPAVTTAAIAAAGALAHGR